MKINLVKEDEKYDVLQLGRGHKNKIVVMKNPGVDYFKNVDFGEFEESSEIRESALTGLLTKENLYLIFIQSECQFTETQIVEAIKNYYQMKNPLEFQDTLVFGNDINFACNGTVKTSQYLIKHPRLRDYVQDYVREDYADSYIHINTKRWTLQEFFGLEKLPTKSSEEILNVE